MLVVPPVEGNMMFLAASRTGEMLMVLNRNQNAHCISSLFKLSAEPPSVYLQPDLYRRTDEVEGLGPSYRVFVETKHNRRL